MRNQSRRIPSVFLVPFFLLSVTSLAQQGSDGERVRNAAEPYRRAAELLEGLPVSDKALINSTAQLYPLRLYGISAPWPEQEPVRFAETFSIGQHSREIANRLEPALRFFHLGADTSEIDWGFDFLTGDLTSPLPQLPIVPELVECVLFRARYRWAIEDQMGAVDDLQALKDFATHVGSGGDGGLISLVVQFNIERIVIHTLTDWLVNAESAGFLREVAKEPNRPSVNLPQKALLLETETVLPLAKNLIDTSQLTAEQRRERYELDLFADVYSIGQLVRRYSEKGLLDQIEESHSHYNEVGALLDLPVDEFQSEFVGCIDNLQSSNNFFSKVGLVECPGIERSYYDIKELQVRWLMLQAAVDIMRSGSDLLTKHTDPFVDGPFEYHPGDNGFELTSKLVVNGAPVKMRFRTAHVGLP